MIIDSLCALYVSGQCLTLRQAQVFSSSSFSVCYFFGAICTVDIVVLVTVFWPSTFLLSHFWHMATWFLFISLRKSFCSLPALKALTRRTLLAQVCLQAKFFRLFWHHVRANRFVGPHTKASTMLLNKVVVLHFSAHRYPTFNIILFLPAAFSWFSRSAVFMVHFVIFMFLSSFDVHVSIAFMSSAFPFVLIVISFLFPCHMFTCTCSGFSLSWVWACDFFVLRSIVSREAQSGFQTVMRSGVQFCVLPNLSLFLGLVFALAQFGFQSVMQSGVARNLYTSFRSCLVTGALWLLCDCLLIVIFWTHRNARCSRMVAGETCSVPNLEIVSTLSLHM